MFDFRLASPEAMSAARDLVTTMKLPDQYKAMLPGLLLGLRPALTQDRPEIERDYDAMLPMIVEAFAPYYAAMADGVATVYVSNFTEAELRRRDRHHRISGEAAVGVMSSRGLWACPTASQRELGLDIKTGKGNGSGTRFSGEAPGMIEATLGNARFFRRSGPYPLAVVTGTARGVADELELSLDGVAPLQTAGPTEVSFLDNRQYASALDQTLAGAVIVHPDMAARVPRTAVAILTNEPYAAWARVAALFYPVPPPCPGVHPSSVVADGARIDPSAEVGPLAVIESGAEIGPGCWIGPGAIIGGGVIVGRDCRIGAHVSLSYALLGARVYVYPGARIGQEGFGFATTKEGFLSVPQLGRVILEDDVEVGANTTIDRGSSQDTVIGAGSRLDNLVQIGHNVVLGRCCVIVAQVGISGSTVLGDFVRVGGQAGMAGHLRIGEGAEIGAQAGVISDVAAGAKVLGSPAQPIKNFFRQIATLRKIAGGEDNPA